LPLCGLAGRRELVSSLLILRLLVTSWLVASLTGSVCTITLDAQTQPGPRVIWWYNASAGRKTPVGLLYTNETLRSLAAAQPGGSVSPRIADAVRQQLAIVIMWDFPAVVGQEPWRRPYGMTIVERGSGPYGVRFNPIWVLQTADDLRAIDKETEFQDVGAMAAFAPSAFLTGRQILLYSAISSSPGPHGERWGTIESDDVAPSDR
jgi:hypothetical protein